MKYYSILMTLLVVITLAWICLGELQAKVEAPVEMEAIKSTDIPAFENLPKQTELVATFYRLLLQDEPPTLKDEQALFEDSFLRTNLIEVHGKDRNDPVILNLCRENKELFIPKSKTKEELLGKIFITTPFDIPRNLRRQQERHGQQEKKHVYVMAWLLLDRSGKSHEIVFFIEGDKLSTAGIWLDGFSSTNATILETRFLKTKDGKWGFKVPGRE